MGNRLVITNGLLLLCAVSSRRRAIRCVLAIVLAMCWAYQPSMVREEFTLDPGGKERKDWHEMLRKGGKSGGGGDGGGGGREGEGKGEG